MTCGQEDATRCSRSVYVVKVGDTYFIGFRGEVNEDPDHPVHDPARSRSARARAARRPRPPRRHPLLRPRDAQPRARLGPRRPQRPRHAAAHQRRRSAPATTASTSRRWPPSASTGSPQYLAGDLDDIDGTLNLDAGTGTNTLLISDEGNTTGKGTAATPVLVTDNRPRRSAATPRSPAASRALGRRRRDLRRRARHRLDHLVRAPPTGTFASPDGIRIWTGSGADVLTVNGTHHRAGTRTTTWLNTGLGNDVLNVDLMAGRGRLPRAEHAGPVRRRRSTRRHRSANGDGPIADDIVGGAARRRRRFRRTGSS